MAKEINNNRIKLTYTETSQLEQFKSSQKKSRKIKRPAVPIAAAALCMVFLYLFSIGFFVIPTVSKPDMTYFITKGTEKLRGLMAYIGGDSSAYSIATIVRYTVVVLAGAALSVAGAVFQGSFKNIIASPTSMGVQSGAMLGNALYLLLCTVPVSGVVVLRYDNEAYYNLNIFQQNLQQLFALAGSFAAIIIVVQITKALGKGRFTSGNILFGGLVFSSFTGSITSVIQNYFLFSDVDNSRINALRIYSMGTFDRVTTLVHLGIVAAVLVPAVAVMVIIAPKLNVLVMGEEEAASMGINVKRLKRGVIAAGTLMAAVVYAFCGSIGFMGFIVPQIARKLVGHDFRRLILMCIFTGGSIMLLVYNTALYMGLSVYLNIITSVIGCTMMAGSLIFGKGAKMYE